MILTVEMKTNSEFIVYFFIFFYTLTLKVMGSVIVEDVTARWAGMGGSVSTHVPARCLRRRASGSAKEALLCLALEGVSEGSQALSPPPVLRVQCIQFMYILFNIISHTILLSCDASIRKDSSLQN